MIRRLAVSLHRYRRCPHCGSRKVRRSRRVLLPARALAGLLSLRFYRCQDCWNRYLGWLFAKAH